MPRASAPGAVNQVQHERLSQCTKAAEGATVAPGEHSTVLSASSHVLNAAVLFAARLQPREGLHPEQPRVILHVGC